MADDRGDDGGERDSLAPVIPLFGGSSTDKSAKRRAVDDRDLRVPGARSGALVRRLAADRDRDRDDRPVGDDVDGTQTWHPTWVSDRHVADADEEATPAAEVAEKVLLKKLRTRSLSVSEARAVLREHDLDDAQTDHIVAAMAEYGYLDDAALAEQLVHAGAERKGQGRQAIAQTLAKRGIPRDVADTALAALPDDDLERALEYARGKARSLRDLERDTALRRLAGQLARRGYGGSLALTAARMALDERPAASSGGVRFV